MEWKKVPVMTVDFDLENQKFVALNGGPVFKFNEAISFQVLCDTQEEWTIIGRNCRKMATKMRNNVAGSRTNMEFLGKLYLRFCLK